MGTMEGWWKRYDIESGNRVFMNFHSKGKKYLVTISRSRDEEVQEYTITAKEILKKGLVE